MKHSAFRLTGHLRPLHIHQCVKRRSIPNASSHRSFHASTRLDVVKPFLLADIGEGIRECQVIQWFVQPGARVEEFDKLLEVQSDKATVEITSPFDGVIKKLYYEPDDMAITGKPLVDIDIQGDISPADEAKLAGGAGEESATVEGESGGDTQKTIEATCTEESGGDTKKTIEATELREEEVKAEGGGEAEVEGPLGKANKQEESQQRRPRSSDTHGSLATPAVRHLIKEHNLEIKNIEGTGKDGLVLKEDVHRHVSQGTQQQKRSTPTPATQQAERKVALTPVQNKMFELMTRSLNIPHFLYTCTATMDAITVLRKALNALSKPEQKLTHLPFVIKAVSLAFQDHPLLNSSIDAQDPKRPELAYHSVHHFGVAVDTPSGLLVPVLKNVQNLSIMEIAAHLYDLSDRARNNKLSPSDVSGATFNVSNIGSVGGGVVAPIISEPQVAILGVGRSKVVPAFDKDEELVKREELTLSWSADHRIVDGAECARCAERVKGLLENPGRMMVEMR